MAITDNIICCLSPSLKVGGYTLLDYSPVRNHGSLVNMDATDWSATPKGVVLDYDGTNDGVRTPHHSVYNTLTTALTVSAWVYPTGGTGNFRNVVTRAAGTGATARQFSIYISNANLWSANIVTTTSTFDLPVGSSTIVLNQWTHVTLRFNGSAVTMFVNGRSIGQNSISGTLRTQTAGIVLGQFWDGSSIFSPYTGKIGEVCVWSRVLTDAEVWNLSQSASDIVGRTLIGQFRRRAYGYVPPSFKPYWAQRQNKIIGGGVQ